MALVGAAITTAALTALTLPLARSSGLEAPTISGGARVAGFTLATSVIVLLIHTPLIALLARRRPRMSRVWVALCSVLLVVVFFMLLAVIETGSLMPLVWNVEGWIERPLAFVADWLPFLAGAAAYGTIASRPGNVT